MPRTSEQFKEMKDERIASILEASLPLFIEFGLKKTTIDKICTKAKCSHGLVYHYFKDVNEVYNALLKTPTYIELKNSVLMVQKGELAFPTLQNIIKVLLKAAENTTNSLFAHLIINEEGKGSFVETLTKLLKQGQKEGEVLAGDPKDLANLFICFFKGLYYKNMTTKNEIEIPSYDVVMYLIKKNRY